MTISFIKSFEGLNVMKDSIFKFFGAIYENRTKGFVF